MKPTPTTAMIEAAAKWVFEHYPDAGSGLRSRYMDAFYAGVAAAPHPTKPQGAYAPDHPKNLEDGTPCQYVSRAQPADITAKVERARTSLAHIECFYVENDDDRKRVRSILDAFEALSSQRAEGIEEGLDYGPGSPWSEGYHSGHAAGWRQGVRADILRLLRADLAEEDAERHAQRIAVIDDALTQDAG